MVAGLVFGINTAPAQTSPPRPPVPPCVNPSRPAGAPEGAVQLWCSGPLKPIINSAVSGPNSWRDEFNTTGMSMDNFALSSAYAEFNTPGTASQTFQHMDHWMPDVAASTPGGAGITMMRPNRTFRAENGVLVVETEYASAIPAYGSNQAWGEIDITTAPAPTENRPDGLYAYDWFKGH